MASNTTSDKVRENRLRRMAARQGFALKKSARRDRYAPDYGQMWLLRERVWNGIAWEDVASPERTASAWDGPFSSYEEVERFLTREHRRESDDAR